MEVPITFIVVYGAPRTGTSLCMDIVQAAGYCAGVCHKASSDKRAGRNEHPLFGKTSIDNENAWRAIRNQRISCAKIIGFYDWIQLLATKFDIKILAPYREQETRRKSIRSRNVAGQVMRRTGTPPFTQEELDRKTEFMRRERILLQDKVLCERELILSQYTHLRVSFEKLIDRDTDEFDRIAEFLNCDSACLINCVDRERVRFPHATSRPKGQREAQGFC